MSDYDKRIVKFIICVLLTFFAIGLGVAVKTSSVPAFMTAIGVVMGFVAVSGVIIWFWTKVFKV